MDRSTRYVAIGFVLGVAITRRLGRRGRRARRRATWQRFAMEGAALAFAVREIAAELEAYEGNRREIGSPRRTAIGDSGSTTRQLGEVR